MLSWHKNPSRKAKYLERINHFELTERAPAIPLRREDSRAPAFIQECVWAEDVQRGNILGCLIKSPDKDQLPIRTGIPLDFLLIAEHLYESLKGFPSGRYYIKFPYLFYDSIPVGRPEEYFQQRASQYLETVRKDYMADGLHAQELLPADSIPQLVDKVARSRVYEEPRKAYYKRCCMYLLNS